MAENIRQPPKQQSAFDRWMSRIIKMFAYLLLSLIFSIASEFIGMNSYWPEQGAQHSEDMLRKELGYLNEDFKHSLLVSAPVVFATNTANKAYEVFFRRSGIAAKVHNSLKDRESTQFEKVLAEYTMAAMNITQLFAVRLAILLLALPAFFIFAAVASVEGLVQRDIRKWSIGREHASLYHHAKRWIPIFFVAPWVVYLSIPFSIHPNFVILPFAVMFGFGVFLVTYLFKKYI